jgi:hypothetical protein
MLSDTAFVNDFSPPSISQSKASNMTPKPALILMIAVGLFLSLAPAPAPAAAPPERAQPIFTVDQVKVGMKGYGMTVFHGTEIEPFAVEVVSINANETPNRSVIWVRCTDERMIHTGPVQGMSGSPIYLWGEGEDPKLGQGGKLIGAFAFGYGDTNECIAGIQPIEYMRAVGGRATADDRPKLSKAAPAGSGLALMSRIHESSKQMDVPKLTRARAEVLAEIYKSITPGGGDDEAAGKRPMLAGPRGQGTAARMMVPMAVGSDAIARAVAPTLTPLGIQPFAADPSALGGKPPKGFDTDNVELEPGSALVVPFAWGDADLSGAGTVTDVLPDGTVLGFGHAMDGVGVTAIPMATGYVHFIVSLRTISYKRSGTLELKGALVQDEQAAVAGTSDKPYTTAPVHVDVNIEGQPKYAYDYTVVNHPQMTPMIAAVVVAQSTEAVQTAPMRHTVRYNTKVKFSTGDELELKSAAIGAGGQAAAMDIMQVVGSLTQSPFEEVELESVNATIDIDYGLDAYEIFTAKLNQTTAAPGDTVTATVELLGLHEEPVKKTIDIKIPNDMPEGDTQVMIADSAMYTQLLLQSRPYLNQIDSTQDLVKALKQVFSTDPTTLYAVLPTRRVSVALDGQGLPDVPTSKAVILGNNNPKAQLYQSLQTTEHEMDRIIMGNAQLQLKIQRKRGAR